MIAHRLVRDREAFAGFAGGRIGENGDALSLEKPSKMRTPSAAKRGKGTNLAAQKMDRTGDVQAATTRIIALGAAAQFGACGDMRHRGRDIECGVQGDGENVTHGGLV